MCTKKKPNKARFQEKNNATLHCQEPACKLIKLPLQKKKKKSGGAYWGVIATF